MKRTEESIQNGLLDSSGELKQEWLDVFNEFPDRFILGSDQFYQAPGIDRDLPNGAESTVEIISKLPSNLVNKFSYENVNTLYQLQ